MSLSISIFRSLVIASLGLILFLGSTLYANAATTTLSAADDTYSTTFAPGQQKGNLSFIRVQDINKNTGKYKHMHRGFIAFDASSIPASSTVDSAVLRLFVSQAAQPGIVDLQLVEQTWNEATLTMNNVPDVDYAQFAQITVDASDLNTFIEIDITDEMAAWVADSSANHGIMISPRGTAVEFGAKDGGQVAEVVVSYTDNTPAGRPLIVSGLPEGPNNTIAIFTNPNYAYNYTVDWGDGSTTQETGDTVHEYGSIADDPIITISGDFPALYSPGGQLLEDGIISTIVQWGDNQWQSLERAFYDSKQQILITATDTPNLSQTVSISEMFAAPIDFQPLDISNINNWDTSNVQDMSGFLLGQQEVDVDLASWDVSNVTDMSEMFAGTNGTIGDLSGWNVSNVTDMRAMFGGADGIVGDLANWDVSNVTDMNSMFGEFGSFTGVVGFGDISSWDTSGVTDMENIFDQSTMINYNLGSWNLSSMSTAIDLPLMETEDYSDTLIGWAAQSPNLNNGVTVDAINQYNGSATSSRDFLINTHNWTINDDGLEI